jgi:hypothetical protein
MNNHPKEIYVRVSEDEHTMRKGSAVEAINLDLLSENVKVFLSQIEKLLDKAPNETAGFKLTEFSVTAEISAKGSLTILGSGVETSGTGGLTFKFERK